VRASLSRLDQIAADGDIRGPALTALRASLDHPPGSALPPVARPAGSRRGRRAAEHTGIWGGSAGSQGGHWRAARGTAALARRRPPARLQLAYAGTRTRSRGTHLPAGATTT